MSIKLYDEALLKKLNQWTAGTNALLTSVNESRKLFETLSDRKNDNPISLPLIALSRPGGYQILNKNKRPISFNGSPLVRSNRSHADLNAIPIKINYQLDIYTRYLEEADEYARNFVFNFINYPKLTIDIPYEDLALRHVANVRISSDVEDNSDIPERLISGQFSRFTIGLNIDDAYLFDVRVRDNVSIKDLVIDTKDTQELIDIN